jgi:predicted acetyltransferase
MSSLDEELIDPAVSYRDEFIAYCAEFRAASEPFVHGQLADAEADFAGLVRRWADQARGVGLPEGWVPASTFWYVRDERILGTIRLRHRLNDALTHEGGHIGFDVRPTERRRGVATRMLASVLDRARELGLTGVLITCDSDNLGSVRAIQRNGGVLRNAVFSQHSGKRVQRYWIHLTAQRTARGSRRRSRSAAMAVAGDEAGLEKLRGFFGPGMVDRAIRHAIQSCWTLLPPARRNAADVEQEIRYLVERALAALREDDARFKR